MFFFLSFAFADSLPYSLPITRAGKEYQMIAYDWWSGEYPQPAILVKGEKNVQIEGYSSLRVKKEKKTCTILSGVYHPWARKKTSVITFYSLASKVTYSISQDEDPKLQESAFSKGDQIQSLSYIGENMCFFVLQKNGEKKHTGFSDSCTRIEKEYIIETKHPSHSAEQWLYLRCAEKYNVFVQDESLLQQTGNQQTDIIGYGQLRE